MRLQYKSLSVEFDTAIQITSLKIGTYRTVNLSLKQSVAAAFGLLILFYLLITQSITLSMVSALLKLSGWAVTLTVSIYFGYQVLFQPSKKRANNQSISQSYYVLPSIGKTAIGFTIDPEELKRINQTIKHDNQSADSGSTNLSEKPDAEFKESVINYEPNPIGSEQPVDGNQLARKSISPLAEKPSNHTLTPSLNHWKRFYQLHEELVNTEQTYVDALKLCQIVYQIPIKQAINQKSLKLSSTDYDTMFSNIDAIYQFHTMFLAEMRRIQQSIKHCSDKSIGPAGATSANSSTNIQTSNIGQLFVKFSDFLKMYTTYIGNYSACLSLINQSTSNNQSIKQFLIKQKSASANQAGLDLMSYLIQPIQRIPRYEMLLTGLLQSAEQAIKQSTTQASSQVDPTLICCLQSALQKIHAIAVLVNERKRDIENASFILEIQNRIKNRPAQQSGQQTSNSLLQPHRKLIRVDDVNVLKREPKRSIMMRSNTQSANPSLSKVSPLVCLMFNDLLVLVKQDSYEFKREIAINQIVSLDINVAEASICWLVVNDGSSSGKRDKVELQFPGRTNRDSWACSMDEMMRKT